MTATDGPVSSSELLRRAWQEIDPNDPMAPLRRRSIEAAVSGHPDLELTLAEMKAPVQARLELHVIGATVRDNAAPAAAVGLFLRGMAAAVKEVAKSLSGRARYPEYLLTSALAPGSIRLALQVPDRDEGTRQGVIVASDSHATSIDSQALWTIAAIFDQAEHPAQQQAAEATVANLVPKARAAVRRLARAVADADWTLDGVVTQRGRTAFPISAGRTAAVRIIALTGEEDVTARDVALYGEIDGLRRSQATMWFIPERASPFTVSVPDPSLQERVAQLAAVTDQRVRVDLTEFLSSSEHGARAGRRSYILREIAAAGHEPTLDVE